MGYQGCTRYILQGRENFGLTHFALVATLFQSGIGNIVMSDALFLHLFPVCVHLSFVWKQLTDEWFFCSNPLL